MEPPSFPRNGTVFSRIPHCIYMTCIFSFPQSLTGPLSVSVILILLKNMGQVFYGMPSVWMCLLFSPNETRVVSLGEEQHRSATPSSLCHMETGMRLGWLLTEEVNRLIC
jgi:hypothetical protein